MELIKVILTSLLSAVSLFIIAKIMGHKQMTQLDFFDYITGITIGSIAAELATELESPWKPLLAMIVYGIVALSLTVIAHKFPKSRKFVNGTPTIVMNNGKLYRENMKKAKLELSEYSGFSILYAKTKTIVKNRAQKSPSKIYSGISIILL